MEWIDCSSFFPLQNGVLSSPPGCVVRMPTKTINRWIQKHVCLTTKERGGGGVSFSCRIILDILSQCKQSHSNTDWQGFACFCHFWLINQENKWQHWIRSLLNRNKRMLTCCNHNVYFLLSFNIKVPKFGKCNRFIGIYNNKWQISDQISEEYWSLFRYENNAFLCNPYKIIVGNL